MAHVVLWDHGSGIVNINKTYDISYFTRMQDRYRSTVFSSLHLRDSYCTCREQILYPLTFLDMIQRFDIDLTVEGGGYTGQAGAARYAIATALKSFVDEATIEKMRLGKIFWITELTIFPCLIQLVY